MTSVLKAKITGNGGGGEEENKAEADKYRLRVSAGPSYDTELHEPVLVNTDTATYIENEFMRAKVKVRIRGYQGLPSSCPAHSPYFDSSTHSKDQYSLGFSFVPKCDLPALDTVWGNDFDHPVRDRLPPGFNTAFRIVKEFIDPGLQCDAYADEPWLYGPSLSSWFAFRIGELVADGEDFPAPSEDVAMIDGADGEEATRLRTELGIPEAGEKRRKFFLDSANREKFTFRKGRLYQADFYNPYLDFGKLALKLPGLSIGVARYIGGKTHCLRYVFKNRATGDLYLNVNFRLLFGQGLQDALEADRREQQARSSDKNGTRDSVRDGEVETGLDPTKMQSHESHQPNGIESATSGASSKSPESHPREHDSVDEISELLERTATGDRSNAKTNIFE